MLPAVGKFPYQGHLLSISSVVDPEPDPYWIRYSEALWIRIWICVQNTDPDPVK